MKDIEYYKSKIESTKVRIRDLEEQMERAGVGSKGDFINQISSEEENLKYYYEHLYKLETPKTPSQVKIFFYILVSIKTKVERNIGVDLYAYFEKDRYHDTEYSQWKPFKGELNIEELVSDVKNSYNINPIYLDGEIDNEHWINIDDEIENSVSVIDLFSLDDNNLLIANKFDTKKAGVLMPICRSLHDDLVNFSDNINSRFNILRAKSNKQISCECYVTDLSRSATFKHELLRIFKQKFPIKNQSSTPSLFRGLNTDFA